MTEGPNPIDSSSRTTILVHYYRAMVGRADIWRTRMDTTTNWAIGATAAIISFTLGNDSVPHYVVSIAALMTGTFLLLEARRLTFYHLWQKRVLLLEEGLVRPALSATRPDASTPAVDLATALDPHLGRTVPIMPLKKAVARRLRRVYLYLFAVQLLAWTLKLANHPTPATSLATVVERAHIGVLAGAVVIAIGGVLALAAILISITQGGVDRDPS